MSLSSRGFVAVLLTAACAFAVPATAGADDHADFEALRREVQELRRRDAEQQREIEGLKQQLQQRQAPAPIAAPTSPLDRAVEAVAAAPAPAPAPAPTEGTALFTRRVGSAQIKLLDVSFDTLLSVGGSTARDAEIAELEGGAHDPKRRGFTLQQAELSFTGAVDPYFTAEAHVVTTPGAVELEEAFFTTTSLPANLQLEGGYLLTEFGRINPTHPHAWDWLDQPVVNTRMFGGEGLRSPGARLGWLTPLPWFSELHLGVQNANEGERTASFMADESVGGRPVVKQSVGSMKDLLYLTRWNNSWNWNDSLTTALGFSGLFGPNGTGGDGRTYLYGTDMTWKWQPPDHFRGWPFVTWQTEVMKRDYQADRFVAGTEVEGDEGHEHAHAHAQEQEAEDVAGAWLRDWGLYTQVLWGFRHGWAAGVRYDYASGSGASLDGGRQADFLRDDRHRVSPLIVWQPSEFSRLRLQYDFDHAGFLPGHDAHSVWMGFEVLYGAHPAHQY